jgi:Tol biopolymer transport system component
VIIALVAIGLTVVAVVRRDAGPPLPPIAYAGETDLRQFDLFVADDGVRRQLTDDKLSYAPSYSPHGSQIAFIRGKPGSATECCGYSHERIWVMDANGSDAYPVSPPQWSPASTPQWMPDGQSILFTVIRKYQGNADAADLVHVDLVSGEVSVLRPFLPTYEFALSPDGTQIAQPRRDGIALIDIATGDEHRVGAGVIKSSSAIAWSTDGQHLAFDAIAEGVAAPRLWVWDLDASQLLPIATGPGEPAGHTWLDPRQLLYCYVSSNDADGGESTQQSGLNVATISSGRVLQQPVTEFADSSTSDDADPCRGEGMDAQITD